jgi:hypothetical protein
MTFDPSLFARVHAASDALTDEIEAARRTAILAIRAVESRLVDALGETRLRGLPNLVADMHNAKLYAARVRGKPDQPLLVDWEGTPSNPALVIAADGRLSMACRTAASVKVSPALDVELQAEDLQHYTQRLTDVLQEHLKRAAELTDKFSRIRQLAEKLKEAVG